MKLNLDAQIEAILFFKGEPISLKKIAEYLSVGLSDVKEGLIALEARLNKSGLTVISDGSEIMLGTSQEASELIGKIAKDELSKDIGRAGLETLSIILYKSPISKREIDYIRGVNSGFVLRNLLIRGLVERKESHSVRGYMYKPTLELLSLLGVSKISHLPEYEAVVSELEEIDKQNSENEEVGLTQTENE